MPKKILAAVIITAAACAWLTPQAGAQPAATSADTVRAWALYQGPDRQAKLLEAAQHEGGEINVYHAYPQLVVLLEAFGKKYGFKVNPWRSNSEGILQRMTSEYRAGRFDIDLVQNNAPEMEAAHREKLLQEVRSPYTADLIPQAVPAHHEWVGVTLDVWATAYNTDKVKREDLPKSYEDLQDPKWKGRLGVEAEDQGWFGTLMDALGHERGVKLFNKIIAANGISVRKGHSLLSNLVASGEVPVALSAYNWSVGQIKAKTQGKGGNAPIGIHFIPPVIAQPSTIALMSHAPHPATALLLYDFLLTDGQKMLADNSYTVTSTKLPSPVANIEIKYIDPAAALDSQDRWLKMFDTVVLKQAR